MASTEIKHLEVGATVNDIFDLPLTIPYGSVVYGVNANTIQNRTIGGNVSVTYVRTANSIRMTVSGTFTEKGIYTCGAGYGPGPTQQQMISILPIQYVVGSEVITPPVVNPTKYGEHTIYKGSSQNWQFPGYGVYKSGTVPGLTFTTTNLQRISVTGTPTTNGAYEIYWNSYPDDTPYYSVINVVSTLGANVNGTWVNAKAVWVNVNGTWHKAKSISGKDNGAWKTKNLE